jgi:hypothetical protein
MTDTVTSPLLFTMLVTSMTGIGVGEGVGTGVGEGVGTGVGEGVGTGVGEGVGTGIGEGVGTNDEHLRSDNGVGAMLTYSFPVHTVKGVHTRSTST